MSKRREPAKREGEVWINDDQPTSWSIVLIVKSEDCFQAVGETTPVKVAARHTLLILDAGHESRYNPGDVDAWYEYTDEIPWDESYGYMRRIA